MSTTPAARWREKGEPDPHQGKYDGERHEQPAGHLTDDELANEFFLCDHRRGLDSMMWLTAAKDRIRWLSRRLVKEELKRGELVSDIQKALPHLHSSPVYATKLINEAIAKAGGA